VNGQAWWDAIFTGYAVTNVVILGLVIGSLRHLGRSR
jgi:hypothetical protein